MTITKTDENDNILTGATFQLSGTVTTYEEVTTDKYTESDSGTYYKLKDGSYTTTALTWMTRDNYESTTIKYIKEQVTETKPTTKNNVIATATVDSNGKLTFKGLGAGEYTLTETVTPDGYKTIEPITFTISFNTTIKMFSTNNQDITVGNDNTLSATIQNVKDVANLPETGGIGTTIFYTVGAILVLGAGVLLVVRRRMRAAE